MGHTKAKNSSLLPQKFVARLPLKVCVHISSLIELYKERERERERERRTLASVHI